MPTKFVWVLFYFIVATSTQSLKTLNITACMQQNQNINNVYINGCQFFDNSVWNLGEAPGELDSAVIDFSGSPYRASGGSGGLLVIATGTQAAVIQSLSILGNVTFIVDTSSWFTIRGLLYVEHGYFTVTGQLRVHSILSNGTFITVAAQGNTHTTTNKNKYTTTNTNKNTHTTTTNTNTNKNTNKNTQNTNTQNTNKNTQNTNTQNTNTQNTNTQNTNTQNANTHTNTNKNTHTTTHTTTQPQLTVDVYFNMTYDSLLEVFDDAQLDFGVYTLANCGVVAADNAKFVISGDGTFVSYGPLLLRDNAKIDAESSKSNLIVYSLLYLYDNSQVDTPVMAIGAQLVVQDDAYLTSATLRHDANFRIEGGAVHDVVIEDAMVEIYKNNRVKHITFLNDTHSQLTLGDPTCVTCNFAITELIGIGDVIVFNSFVNVEKMENFHGNFVFEGDNNVLSLTQNTVVDAVVSVSAAYGMVDIIIQNGAQVSVTGQIQIQGTIQIYDGSRLTFLTPLVLYGALSVVSGSTLQVSTYENSLFSNATTTAAPIYISDSLTLNSSTLLIDQQLSQVTTPQAVLYVNGPVDVFGVCEVGFYNITTTNVKYMFMVANSTSLHVIGSILNNNPKIALNVVEYQTTPTTIVTSQFYLCGDPCVVQPAPAPSLTPWMDHYWWVVVLGVVVVFTSGVGAVYYWRKRQRGYDAINE